MKRIVLLICVCAGLSGCIVVDDGVYASTPGYGFMYSASYSFGGPLFGHHHHREPRPRPQPIAERAPFDHPGSKAPAKPPRVVAASRGLPPTVR